MSLSYEWTSTTPPGGSPSPWWRQMETHSALLANCAGNSPVPGEFPAQRPVTRRFDVFFDLRLNKRLSKQWEAGDLRRYRAHYDVTVMYSVVLAGTGTCHKHVFATSALTNIHLAPGGGVDVVATTFGFFICIAPKWYIFCLFVLKVFKFIIVSR